jgi:hypothetical protein
LQLHLVINTEGHDGRILGERNTLHSSDLDPSNLDSGTLTETRHGGEHCDEIVGTPSAYLELPETHGKIRQGTETEHDKQTNCNLEVEAFHGAFLLSLSQSIMLM